MNHSRKPFPQLSRPEKVLADVETEETRDGKVGSQNIDSDWRKIKEKLPKNSNGRTEQRLARLERGVRVAQ